MTILAIDTSTELLSVCLVHKNNYIEVNKKHGLKHAVSLMPLISSLFADMGIEKQDLDLITCARGPGSFTGLRIGISTAKGLSFGIDRPLKLVPTLDAMAYGKEFFNGTVIPVIDARKQRYYSCLYKNGNRIGEYLDISLEKIYTIASEQDTVLFTGPDAPAIDIPLGKKWILDPLFHHSTALSIAALGAVLIEQEGPDPEETGPLYIRKSEAEEAKGF